MKCIYTMGLYISLKHVLGFDFVEQNGSQEQEALSFQVPVSRFTIPGHCVHTIQYTYNTTFFYYHELFLCL